MGYPSNSDDISDDAIAGYVAHLLDLEDEVERVQADKKQFFEHAREAQGRDFVASLKLAVKTARLDADKRLKAEEIDAGAERILEIMRKGLHVARGARAREIIEQFDRETGEIIETEMPVSDQSTAARKDVPPRAAQGGIDPVQVPAVANAEDAAAAGTQAPPVDTIQEPSAVVDVAAQSAVAAPRKDAEAAAPDPVTREGAPAGEVTAPAFASSVNPDCLKAQRGEACQFSHKTYCCSECRNVASAKLADARRGRAA